MASLRLARPVAGLIESSSCTIPLTFARTSSGRVVRHPLKQCRSIGPSSTSRAFTTTRISPTDPSVAKKSLSLSKRVFSSSTSLSIIGQEAPSAQAYIQSGVLARQEDTFVDVKKVLVIGSGGLSIGQAGEFDYSGESRGQNQISIESTISD